MKSSFDEKINLLQTQKYMQSEFVSSILGNQKDRGGIPIYF